MKKLSMGWRTALSINLFTLLSGLFSILMIFSLRGVWVLMNRFVKGAIPLGENSFLAAYIFVLLLVVASAASLIALFKSEKRKQDGVSPWMLIFPIFQLAVYWGLVAIMYPEVQSMYLRLLPVKLLKNGVLIGAIAISAGLCFYSLYRNRLAGGFFWRAVTAVNGLLLIGVISMGYMALTVRTPSYYRNRPEGEVPTYNHKANERFSFDDSRMLKPDLTVELDSEFGGIYWIAGDLTGNDQIEIVSMKYYVEKPDINRVSSMAVQNLNGERLWTWKSEVPGPSKLGMGRGSSAAAVVYDLKKGIEKNKLIFATDGYLYQMDGKSGEIEKKVAVGAVDSSDCLIIADLRGKGKKDLLLKDAYHTIWAFDEDLNLMWKTTDPGGRLLAHRISAFDMDGEGADEILTGSVILNSDGSVRTIFQSDSVKLWYGGHIDGIVPIKQDGQWLIGVTYCDASGIALFDSQGNNIWEVTGAHYEYLVGGYFFPDSNELKDQFQLISKIHYEDGDPQLMVNQDGQILYEFSPAGTAFSVDWTGDGYHELIFYSPASIYSGMEKIHDLEIPGIPEGTPWTMRVADLLGREDRNPDGIPDIGVRTEVDGKHYLHIYVNREGKKPLNYVYPGIGWEEAANYFTKYYEYGNSQ